MPNDRNSPLNIVLGSILGADAPSRPDQKAVSFRIDFDNYVNLCALQGITPKGVSRNQLLNDLLAVAIDEVVSALPPDASDAYENAVEHNREGLTMVLETEGHL